MVQSLVLMKRCRVTCLIKIEQSRAQKRKVRQLTVWHLPLVIANHVCHSHLGCSHMTKTTPQLWSRALHRSSQDCVYFSLLFWWSEDFSAPKGQMQSLPQLAEKGCVRFLLQTLQYMPAFMTILIDCILIPLDLKESCECTMHEHVRSLSAPEVSKCNQSRSPSNCIGFHGHQVMRRESIELSQLRNDVRCQSTNHSLIKLYERYTLVFWSEGPLNWVQGAISKCVYCGDHFCQSYAISPHVGKISLLL